jgi:plastocyanin
MNIWTGAASALTPILVATAPVGAQTSPPALVHIANFNFTPKTLTVAPGRTVTFVNDDGEPHTATAEDNSFDSGGLVLCEMHPYMKGTIVVDARRAKPRTAARFSSTSAGPVPASRSRLGAPDSLHRKRSLPGRTTLRCSRCRQNNAPLSNSRTPQSARKRKSPLRSACRSGR